MQKFNFRELTAFFLVLGTMAVPPFVKAAPVKTRLQGNSKLSSAARFKSAAPVKRGKPKKGSKLFMWKMTSDNGNVIYFLGTIHIARPDFYPLPDEIEKAFDKSKALLVEMDISDKNKKSAKEFEDKGIYRKGDSLLNHISPMTWKALQKYCAAVDMPDEKFLRMKPWYISCAVHGLEMQRLGFRYKQGIDLHFIDKANKSGKKVVGLEQDYHVDVLAAMDEDLQDKVLRLGLINLDMTTSESIDKIMKYWQEGDDLGMDSFESKDEKKHPDLEPYNDRLLYDRNEIMANSIEPYLKGDGQNTYMVAVGSAHLVGSRSVIESLKKRGYKVNQVLVGDQI